jgi:diguanylate cyclase (GGDEF)-like protein
MSTDDIDLLAILRASQALSSETSPGRLRARLGEVLRAMTGATAVLMAERADGSDDWLVFDTGGPTRDAVHLSEAAGMLPVSALRYAQRTGEPLLISDPAHDDRFSRDPYLNRLEHCSFLVVPIFNRRTLRAVLVLENRQRLGAFAASGLDAVMLIIGQLTVSLDNVQLYASLEQKVAQRTAALEQANGKLEAMSHTDALTGLPNRRRFDEMLNTEWRRAVRQSSPLGLAMIDVDSFKRYNDCYGHVVGDDCLRVIASAMRDSLRGDPDVICRYGGEEFSAILPGADLAVSTRIAERLRAAVSALRRPHSGSDSGIVSVSVGVAAHIPKDSVTASDLVATADIALYEAKMNGRDRVCPARL